MIRFRINSVRILLLFIKQLSKIVLALVGSLTIGTTFFLSPIAGILTDKFGIQTTTFVGGAIASVGLLLSSLLTDKVTESKRNISNDRDFYLNLFQNRALPLHVFQVELLFLTYGVMYGLGASLAYTPSLVILGHYFKKYLGLVNGIVTAGSSIFTTLLPSLMEVLLLRLGLEGTLRSLAVLTAIVMACAILFKPIPCKFSLMLTNICIILSMMKIFYRIFHIIFQNFLPFLYNFLRNFSDFLI